MRDSLPSHPPRHAARDARRRLTASPVVLSFPACASRESKVVLREKARKNLSLVSLAAACLPLASSAASATAAAALASPEGKEPGKPASHPSQKPRATKPSFSFPLRPRVAFAYDRIGGSAIKGRWGSAMMSGGGGRSGGRDAEEGEWEVRPGGMLVQRRDGDTGPAVRLRVSYGAAFRDVAVPAQATFGELKRVLTQATGLEPERQRLFFRGKEKSDNEFLHTAGIKDGAKLLLLEKHAPANVEQKVEPTIMDESMMKACEAVGCVRTEVDKLSAKVCDLEKNVVAGRKVEDKEFVVLTELLMMQLLKLDGIEAEGEARAQRKAEVRRVQSLVDTLDKLKARNANPFCDQNKSVSVTTQWETFDNGMGSLNAPPPRVSSTQINTDWEQFD